MHSTWALHGTERILPVSCTKRGLGWYELTDQQLGGHVDVEQHHLVGMRRELRRLVVSNLI